MGKHILNPMGLLLGLTLFIGPARQAKALDVAVVLCDVSMFSCPENDIVPGSLFQFIPNNVLLPNKYIVQSFSADGYTGTFVTADSGGKYIYAWGTGTATADANNTGLYLDVSMRQTYVTAPGKWTFGESLNANCSAAAQGDGSSIAAQGQVIGVNLAVMGGPGDCAGNGGNIVASSGGYQFTLGTRTQMLAGVSFLLGAVGDTITLPFGDDFPDPTINFNDPNNPLNFITNTDIPNGFTPQENTPEPSTLGVMGAGLCAMALLRKRLANARRPIA
jgi:PEP-CTERM motif